MSAETSLAVMAGFIPAIHVLVKLPLEKAWMAGTSPAMTILRLAGALLHFSPA
jgi:hypothetical protein